MPDLHARMYERYFYRASVGVSTAIATCGVNQLAVLLPCSRINHMSIPQRPIRRTFARLTLLFFLMSVEPVVQAMRVMDHSVAPVRIVLSSDPYDKRRRALARRHPGAFYELWSLINV